MKKIVIVLSLVLMLIGCTQTTSIQQDIMMLQKKYPCAVVYPIGGTRYIIVDSIKVSDVEVTLDGKIHSIIEIK